MNEYKVLQDIYVPEIICETSLRPIYNYGEKISLHPHDAEPLIFRGYITPWNPSWDNQSFDYLVYMSVDMGGMHYGPGDKITLRFTEAAPMLRGRAIRPWDQEFSEWWKRYVAWAAQSSPTIDGRPIFNPDIPSFIKPAANFPWQNFPLKGIEL